MLAIVGGSGLSYLDGFKLSAIDAVKTPYARSNVQVSRFSSEQQDFLFLPRHGSEHQLPPHEINYRANIWALSQLGVTQIVAVNAVGGIHASLVPGSSAVPEQIMDYSYGRESTFFDSKSRQVKHIDFARPYTDSLRHFILLAAINANKRLGTHHEMMDGGVYACTQGPRLETAAEIQRLKRDGCDMVGMTGMPEAALARELNIDYACLAFSVNWAAGLTEIPIALDEIHRVLENGMSYIVGVLREVLEITADGRGGNRKE